MAEFHSENSKEGILSEIESVIVESKEKIIAKLHFHTFSQMLARKSELDENGEIFIPKNDFKFFINFIDAENKISKKFFKKFQKSLKQHGPLKEKFIFFCKCAISFPLTSHYL